MKAVRCLESSLAILRAGDGDRTRDVQLGKSAVNRKPNNLRVRRAVQRTEIHGVYDLADKTVGMEHERSTRKSRRLFRY